MATIYAYTSNNITCTYTMTMTRSGNTVTLTVSGTIKGNGSSSDSTSGQALYVQVRTGVSPTNTSGTTTYVSNYGTLLSWASTTTVTGYTGTNSNCMIASNTTSNNLPPLNATGFPTGGRAFTVTYTTTNGAAVSLDDVALFIFKSKTATTAPSNGAYTFIGKKSSSLSGNQIRYVTQDLSVAAATYTVSYNKGANGTGTNTTDTKTYGVALTLKGATFTRAGYYQSGWATSDGGAQAYALSASYTANAAVTLYPVWTAYKLTIKFHANGGTLTTGTGETRYRIDSNEILQRSTDSGATWSDFVSTISQGTEYVNLINIGANAYDGGAKKTAYHIVGTSAYRVGDPTTGTLINWDTASATDTNAATIQNLTGSATLTGNSTIILYTNWVPWQLTVQYNANGGTITTGTGTTRYRVSSNIVQRSTNSGSTWANLTLTSSEQGNWDLHNVTGTTYDGGVYRTGYHVVTNSEFNTTADGTGNDINQGTGTTNPATIYRMNGNAYLTADKTISLYVNWVVNTYTITYNKGSNGFGTNTTDTKTHGTALTLKGAIFTRVGYTQTGWSTTDGGAKVYNLSASYTTEAAVTLYPYWTKNNYTLTFDANGGQVSETSRSVGYATTLTNLPTPTRAGYTFKGWYLSFNGTSAAAINYGRDLMYKNLFSIHFDVFTNTWSTAIGRFISCTESGGFNVENSSGYVNFACHNSGVGYKSATSTKAWTSFDATQWHSFDLIFDGTNAKLYIDGNLEATSADYTSSGVGYNANNNIWLGAEATSSSTSVTTPYFNGYIANFQMSNNATIVPDTTYNSFTMPAQNVTLYAVWERLPYTIKVYHNSSWQYAPAYVYYNGQWQEATVIKIYDGSSWKEP